jgi:hypothetical protein
MSDRLTQEQIEADKFYIRYREGLPETEMQDAARRGFWTMGVETAPFEWVDDIDAMADLGPTVGVAGYIGDVWRGLRKLGKPIPPALDYPPELTDWLGRRVWKSTLDDVRRSIVPTFVKPEVQKQFTGFVWRADQESRRRIVCEPDETVVWCSEPVEFVAEYRACILYERVIGCRLYKGDWGQAVSRHMVESAVKAMGNKAPHAYCLDFGVTDDGRTLLVEANEGYAFGHYGLSAVSYARMLSARWYELAGAP